MKAKDQDLAAAVQRLRDRASERLVEIRKEIVTKGMEMDALRREAKAIREAQGKKTVRTSQMSIMKYNRPLSQEQIRVTLDWFQGRTSGMTGDFVIHLSETFMVGKPPNSIQAEASRYLSWLTVRGYLTRVRHGVYTLAPKTPEGSS